MALFGNKAQTTKIEYRALNTVQECIEASHDRPVFILKHSATCPISSHAKHAVDTIMESHPNTLVYLVVVQKQRPLSNEIADFFKIKHESPQLLLIHQGEVKHVYNHHEINQSNIAPLLT